MEPGLYAAASAGNIDEIMKFKDKILYQVTERTHQTVLHLAALSNNSECVDVILDKFPSLLDKVNSRNETALHLAASKGYKAVVQALLDKANCLNSDEISRPRFDFIRRGNVELDTALHLAVRNNHTKVVKVIVEVDPGDEHSQNLKSETPLYLVASIGRSYWILNAILEKCLNASVDGPEGKTALHAAVISRSYVFIVPILTWRPDLYGRADNKGWTAFHHAASLNSVSALSELLHDKVDLDGRYEVVTAGTADNKTALHIAAYEGHIYILTQLLEYCQAACYEDGRNIVHIAAEQNHKDLILSILQDFPNVVSMLLNREDKDGNTPLHLLVMAGCFVPQLMNPKFIPEELLFDRITEARKMRNKDKFTPEELLYMDEDIVGDQLMIKNAFENARVDIFPNSWHRIMYLWLKNAFKPNHRRPSAEESLVQESKRRRKDAKFKKAKAEIMKEEVELYRKRTNTQIIVTALIATVTFTVGFTMPGGYHDAGDADEGSAILSKKKAFRGCMVADAVGLLFSMSSLFLYFISSLYQDPNKVSKLMAASTVFNIVSVVAMILTFITGTYVVLSHSPALAIAVSVISCVFFLVVIILLIKLIYDPKEKFKL